MEGLKCYNSPMQKVRGFKDIFPPDTLALSSLEASARKMFRLYGVEELRVPTVELKELFVKSTGDTTDIVQKEMYAFEDAGGRLIALRPEGTPGVARAYIEANFAQSAPVQQFYYIGNMFRAERPQAGRFREFEQIGAEFFGNSSPAADAQAILLLKDIIKDFGITKFSVKINSLGCAKCRPVYRQSLIDFLSSQKKDLCEKCQERLDKNPLRVLDCKTDGPKFIKNAPKQTLCPVCQEHFEEVQNLLKGKIDFELDQCLVRGLDYYTGTVFEFQAGKNAQNAIAGGGRYDGLLKSMGGPDMPAVGWALGAERVAAARAEGAPCAQGEDCAQTPRKFADKVFVVALEPAARIPAFNLMQSLRGIGVSALGGLFDKNLKAQMKQADKSCARFALILGSNEVQRSTAVLKNLETGEQREFLQSEIPNRVKQIFDN